MKTVNEMWHEFAEATLPADAGEVQISETRKAFYAGTLSMFVLMSDTAGETTTEKEGADALQTLFEELTEFKEGLKRDIENRK